MPTNPNPSLRTDAAGDAEAYVEQVLETMRRHGAQPKVRKDAVRRTVTKVSRAFDGLKPASRKG